MIILGSTGSIGVNTLKIAKKFNLPVEILVAGKNYQLLQEQINVFKPKIVVVSEKNLVEKITHPHILYAEEGILEALELGESSLVVNALVGFLGLKPTIKALSLGKRVALANKESLVAGGKFIDTSKITPIDSEHFGLWYLLNDKKIASMDITASGGAFRDWDIDKIPFATLEDTQKHPNWSMGQKITIDSATMVNKIFEVLEGYWLFKDYFEEEVKIGGIIETQSLIHALINFADGSTTAHFANASMELPIAYALLKKVDTSILAHIDLIKVQSLEFREIDTKRYPIWDLKEPLLKNLDMGVVINAANEVAIENFINQKCNFLGITQTIFKAFKEYEGLNLHSLDDVFRVDKEIREEFKIQ